MENKTILLSIKPTNNYIIHIMFLIIVIITITHNEHIHILLYSQIAFIIDITVQNIIPFHH